MYVNHGIAEFRCKYNEVKNVYKNTLKSTKINYFSRLVHSSKNKSKLTWSIVSGFINNNHNNNPDVIDSSLDADDFNIFFINKVDEIVNSLPRNNDALNLLNNVPKPNSSFVFNHISVEETFSAILELSNSSTADVYGINSKILKIAAKFICEPLTHIFNSFLDAGLFPDAFKYEALKAKSR